MLDEFPGNPWHVGRTPGEDFPALMEELDEHAFLCGIQVYCDGSSLVGVRGMNLNFLRILCCVESLIRQGSADVR
jgi:hypothetical protein